MGKRKRDKLLGKYFLSHDDRGRLDRQGQIEMAMTFSDGARFYFVEFRSWLTGRRTTTRAKRGRRARSVRTTPANKLEVSSGQVSKSRKRGKVKESGSVRQRDF
jgi:hypothetical protein